MPRRKVTFEYDPAKEKGLWPLDLPLEDRMRGWPSIDPESITVEELPDPAIVEEFVVRVTSPAILGPLRAHHGGEGIIGDVLRGEFHAGRTVEVERRA
jgi:hypothetical protein